MGTVIRPEVSAKNKYWLSKHRYYELKHFCLQYPEWKRVYHDLDGLPARSASVTGFTRGGQTPNPTALYAEARIYYKLATEREKTERKLAEKQLELMEAKRQQIQSQARIEELYTNALNAMKRYSGHDDEDEYLDDY